MHNGLPVSLKPVIDRDRMRKLYDFISGLLSPVPDKSSMGGVFVEFQSRSVLSNLLCLEVNIYIYIYYMLKTYLRIVV
jgi:hypothetical protein